MIKQLLPLLCLMFLGGCSSSYQFVSTSQPDQLRELNLEIENSKVYIDRKNGEDFVARILRVTEDSVFYDISEPASLPVTSVNSIRYGSKAHGFTVLGIALSGYGIYLLATVNDTDNKYTAIDKRFGGLFLLVLGGGSLNFGLKDLEHTYYLN